MGLNSSADVYAHRAFNPCPLKYGVRYRHLLASRKRRTCRNIESCLLTHFDYPDLGFLRVFFPRLQRKCQRITSKNWAHPKLFPGKTDEFHRDLVQL